ncbi:MAG: VOC family protein [Nocardioides sp.]
MASVKQVQVTFDCSDPRAVAEFWKTALGYVDPPVPPGFDSWDAFEATLSSQSQGASWACQDPAGVGPRLFFQRVPEAKTVKNRLHLDVRVGTGLTGDERVSALEAEAARLETHGARRLHLLPADEENEACLVMQDVEGNEFCLD